MVNDLEIYRAVRKQFQTIDAKLDALAAACRTFAQSQQLSDEYAQAQKNYVGARNRLFDTNAKRVSELYEELGAAQSAIEESLASLKQVDKVLDTIGDAVRIATSLVGLGRAV